MQSWQGLRPQRAAPTVSRYLLAVLVAVCVVPRSAAAAIFCAGQLQYLALDQSGLVQIDNGYGVWYICRLSATFNSIVPDACRGIYAGALSAQAQQRSITMAFDLPAGTACSSLGSWVTPTPEPYHIRFDM